MAALPFPMYGTLVNCEDYRDHGGATPFIRA